MKKRMRKELKILLVLIPIFIVFKFFFSSLSEEGLLFSVINKGRTGVSVFYGTLKSFDERVSYNLEDIKSQKDTDIVVFYKGNGDILNPLDDESVIDKIFNEKLTVVFSANDVDLYMESFTDNNQGWKTVDKFHVEGKAAGFRLSKGESNIVFVEARYLMNMRLLKDKETAFWVYEILEENDKTVVFNERYLFGKEKKPNLWTELNRNGKLIIIQLILIIICIIFIKGRKFGKRYPYVEELERIENEYVTSCSAMFYKFKKWNIIYDGYHSEFMDNLTRFLGRRGDTTHKELEELWKNKDFENLKILREIFLTHEKVSEISDKDIKRNKRIYIEGIKNMEKLSGFMKKRRENRWKR